MEKGRLADFDLLGLSFGQKLPLRPRSAESRSDKYSFLKELSPEHMGTYTPAQIAAILEQRDHVSVLFYSKKHDE